MSGPWEKYQAAPAETGPWTKYAGAAAPQASAAAAAIDPAAADQGGTERAVRGVMGAVAPVIAPIGRFVDRFTGAPVRSAIGAVQDGTNPVQAYMNQFGANPEQAPTGQEIARKAGLGDTSLSDVVPGLYSKDGHGMALRKGGMLDPTASGAAGFGVDVVADPLNLLGVGEVADVAKGLGKAGLKSAGESVSLGAKVADAVTGTEAATKSLEAAKAAGSTTKKVYDAAKSSIDQLLKPKLAADAPVMEAIAEKHGIPAELMSPAHEFGDASSITRLQKNIAEGALGQKYLETHNAGIAKTSEALEKNLGDTFGPAPSTAADAGQVLKDAVHDHVSKVFDDADITYKTAAQQFPGIKLDEGGMEALQSKAIGMKREAQKIARTSADATQLSQAANLEKWADVIQSAKGSYKEMADVIQNVGRATFEKTPVGQIPADIRKLKELYNVGSEALIQSIRNKSAAAADRLVVNNSEISEMLSDKSMLGKVLQDPNPERIYNSLIKNGGSAQIETLKRILPPEAYDAMRARYLQDLVHYHPDQMGVNFGATMRKMQANSDKLAYLFKPSELKDMTDLLKFGDRYGKPVLSMSGTGASGGFKGFVKNLHGAVMDENALDYMKAKARGTAAAPAASGEAAAVSASPLSGRPFIRERGGFESRVKAAQSIAPSNYTGRPVMPAKPSGVASAPEKNDAPPARGNEKWANDGFQKLKAHSDDPAKLEAKKSAILAIPEAKKLLVAASDLSPGSKGMANILERIEKLYGSATSKR